MREFAAVRIKLLSENGSRSFQLSNTVEFHSFDRFLIISPISPCTGSESFPDLGTNCQRGVLLHANPVYYHEILRSNARMTCSMTNTTKCDF